MAILLHPIMRKRPRGFPLAVPLTMPRAAPIRHHRFQGHPHRVYMIVITHHRDIPNLLLFHFLLLVINMTWYDVWIRAFKYSDTSRRVTFFLSGINYCIDSTLVYIIPGWILTHLYEGVVRTIPTPP